MIGTLDSQVIEKFKEFQEKTGKYSDLDIEDVQFDKKTINDIIDEFIKGSTPKYSSSSTNTIVIKSGQARGNYNVFDFKNTAYLDLIKVKNPKYLQNGDILINTTGVGTAGRVTLFDLSGSYVSDSHITALRYDLNSFNKFYLLHFFVNYGFKKLEAMAEGSGGQVELSMDKIKPLVIPIPKDYNQKYKSIDIQKVIVEFLEFWKINYTDVFRQTVTHQKPILEKIKKALIPATLRHDKTIVNSFNAFAKMKDYNVKLENIIFNNKPFFKLVAVTNGSEFPAGYVKRKEVKGDIPLISAGVKKDIMGYIKSLQGNNVNIPEKHYVFNDTKQKWNEVKHYNGKDYYTLTADGEGGNIIKRSVNNYPKGFYTTNVCKTLEFDENVIYDSFFYLSYKYTKYKYNFDFANKANNDNLALINIPLPKKYEDFDSINLQKILVEFWEMILNKMVERFIKFDNIERLTDKIDEAFLYRTFSKIGWREE